jgi:aryl-phospho-beta-D-glucosidase BglC (GH1 family)
MKQTSKQLIRAISLVLFIGFNITNTMSQVGNTPTVNAGKDCFAYLPYGKITLKGSDSPKDSIVERKWELLNGTATLGATTDSVLQLSDLIQGEYLLRYTVKDNQGVSNSDTIKVTATYIEPLAPISTDPGRVITMQFASGRTLVTPEGQRLRGYWEGGYKNTLDYNFNNPDYFKNLRNMGFNAVKVWWDNQNEGGNGNYTDVNDSAEVARSLSYMDTIVNMASRYGLQIMIEGGNISYYQDPPSAELNFRVENLAQWWSILARRYKDRTHVSYEMQNLYLFIPTL